MRIRDALLAIAATVVAGTAAVGPAMAQDFRPVAETAVAPAAEAHLYQAAYDPARRDYYMHRRAYYMNRRAHYAARRSYYHHRENYYLNRRAYNYTH